MPVTNVRPAVPASQIVNVIPSVLSAGGNALDLIGLVLTQNTRVPIGQVIRLPNDGTSAASYFGSTAHETALASVYFLGPDNSTAKPAALLYAQYPFAAVSAYLRGGSVAAMTLTQLQALNAPLSVTIDSLVKTASINLASATSFSNAAEIVADDLGIEGVQSATFTGQVGAHVTASTTGTTLTVTAIANGYLSVGDIVTGTDGTNSLPGSDAILSQLSGSPGSTGTYQLSAAATPGNMASSAVVAGSIVLHATVVATGVIGLGDVITGTGVSTGAYVTAQISGTTGGVGFYTLGGTTPISTVSEAMIAFSPAIQYDSVSGAFVIMSGTTGVSSTITYGTGSLATSLKLTAATGALISPGATATDPATFMDEIVTITQNWASFMTAWEPVAADKIAFSAWNNGKNNRYHYAMYDTGAASTTSGGPAPAPLAINTAGYSGTSMIYEDPNVDTVGGLLAAFVMGYVASLDFTRFNGRETAAFKAQEGLLPQVTSGTVASYLLSYGMNFYGDYTTANQAFVFYNNGSVSGPFLWLDSYANQIWLNNQLQLAIMVLLTTVGNLPYNSEGYALIESACMDPINEAVNFGAINVGVALSAAQIAEVNRIAGAKVDGIIQTRGWYFQVIPAIAQVRRARTSPPCTLLYADGGAIQQITLASIEVQ